MIDRKSANKNLRKLLIQQKEEEVKSKKEEGGSNPTTTQDLTRRIHTARVNLNYTIFFPLTEKYIALYADEQKKKKGKEKGRGKTSEDHSQSDVDDEVSQSDDTPKPDMWYIVERCMKEDAGKLELLREGKLDTSSPGLDVLPAEGEEGGAGDSGTKSNRKEKRKGRGEEKEPEETSRVSDDSDGGFFE